MCVHVCANVWLISSDGAIICQRTHARNASQKREKNHKPSDKKWKFLDIFIVNQINFSLNGDLSEKNWKENYRTKLFGLFLILQFMDKTFAINITVLNGLQF